MTVLEDEDDYKPLYIREDRGWTDSHVKEERTLSDSEEQVIERNSLKECSDVPPAGRRMISYPHRWQAWHPNFDAEV